MRRYFAAAALAALAAASAARCFAADDNSNKEFPWDKGPDTIDVSKYPKNQQENYLIFAEKCSKCHTLARPINSPYALPEEWESYVRKMQQKKRSGVDEDSAAKIISFLAYDSSIRKKDLIAQKLKAKKEGKSADEKSTPKAKTGDSGKKPEAQ